MARKPSGGKYKKARKKKLSELPGQPRLVRLGQEKKKLLRTRGGRLRHVLLATNKANVLDPETKKSKVVQIKAVKETPANPVLARENIMVKGALIETELGIAKITNRPGQEGCIQAVLLKKEKAEKAE